MVFKILTARWSEETIKIWNFWRRLFLETECSLQFDNASNTYFRHKKCMQSPILCLLNLKTLFFQAACNAKKYLVVNHWFGLGHI